MDAKKLNKKIKREDSERAQLLKLLNSMPGQQEVVVRTFLSNDTRDPWRGDYANMESNSR